MSAARLHKRAKKAAAKKRGAATRKTAAKAVVKAAVREIAQQNRGDNQNNPRRKIGQYHHGNHAAQRLNIPPAGIALLGSDNQQAQTQYDFDPHLQPQLNWRNKRQRDQLSIPLQPLHIHERIDPRAIIRAVQKNNGNGQQLPFELPEANPPLERAVEFYQHPQNWANRLIAGDSLLVCNSLLEKESMGEKVQCVYMDPPYGIKFGGNFQPFVNERGVKDGNDQDLTTEPEMIRAFRDTWELGIHSYLSYLRDRLALCRELLAESGSCFVQISDENVHLVRNIMDEVFGSDNFVAQIVLKTRSTSTDMLLPTLNDYIVWYGKDKSAIKYRQIFQEKAIDYDRFSLTEIDGEIVSVRTLSQSERAKARPFSSSSLSSTTGNAASSQPFEYQGRVYHPAENRGWRCAIDGLSELAKKGRLLPQGNTLRYKYYHDDFPFVPLSNLWDKQISEQSKIYVVQTGTEAAQRCILMSTDPGDLVFDPTCGSGTTACVAEQWGRRWITCDASRVALAVARQRLMTAHFPYYKLRDERAGAGGGFVCKTVPHITLKSIANGERPQTETIHDKPHEDGKRRRITGPFTVEAIPSPVTVRTVSPEEIRDGVANPESASDGAAVSSRESSRHQAWRDELSANGARGKDGDVVRFSRVETCGGNLLHLEVEAEGKDPEYGFVSFGPEHAPMSSEHVDKAIEEAGKRSPRPRLLVFAAFAFDPQAAKTLDEFGWRGGRIVKAAMDPDLHVQDLKRKKRGAKDAAFWLMGRPDAELRRAEGGPDSEEWEVEVLGFDYYNPLREGAGRLETGGREQIAMWMLDTDYDGRQLYPRQVFFPMSENKGWERLARNLRAELDEERMERYRGTVSLPFRLGDFRRAAVKIVDKRGIESLRVLEAPEQ